MQADPTQSSRSGSFHRSDHTSSDRAARAAAAAAPPPSRTGRLAPIGVFLVGLLLTGLFLGMLSVTRSSPPGALLFRYCCGHPIEECEVWLFFWGMAALAWKACQLGAERRVLGTPLLPLAPGVSVKAADADRLLQGVSLLPRTVRTTWLGRRLDDGLRYVAQRGAADGLEERLTLLSDRDADALEGSYELVRIVTWAIPILGFLGTVVGITIAIAQITPEQLQDSLDQVVGGLAIAFDTTALALALAMGLVLMKFLVEKSEKATLGRVDAATDEILLHRFDSQPAETRMFLGMIEGVAGVMMRSIQDAWREHGQLWTKAVEQVGEAQVAALQDATQDIIATSGTMARQAVLDQTYQFTDVLNRLDAMRQASESIVGSLRETARETLAEAREQAQLTAVEQETRFARLLGGLESSARSWQESLTSAAANLATSQKDLTRQTEVIAQLVLEGGQLAAMQQALNQNLAVIANTQALDEAIHSLTAAAHLLTARAGRVGAGPKLSVSTGPPTEAAA